MKAAGAAALFFAFLYGGICAVREKRAKIRGLHEICSALEILYGELDARDPSIRELSRILCERGTGTAKQLFSCLHALLPLLGEESFSSLWARAVYASCRDQDRAVIDELLELGNALGRYDTRTQTRAIRSCLDRLCRLRDEMEQAFPGDRKLWVGLGAAVGALTAVMLI